MSEHKGVWVYCETDESRLKRVALELVTKARDLADTLGEDVVAVLIGSDIERHAEGLIWQGADRVLVVNDEVFANYTTDAYSKALANLIEERKPSMLLVGGTTNGRDLAPRVAAKLKLGLTADCTGLKLNDKKQLVQIRPAFSGKVMVELVSPETRPQMTTVRPNVFKPAEPDNSRSGDIEHVKIQISQDDIRTEILERVKEVVEGMISVDEAEVVVCSGRGIKEPENLKLPEELAKLLDAAVGGTRPIVDLGWLPPTQQVGQSGRTILPNLYFALGISGAIQHCAGMSDSEVIVAVNKDPDAPIFELSDFGIVGDLFEIVPEIITEIKRVQSER
ncbi:MAG: electron transfer flavoprotein subunit alpha/FixB family protein [Candidatus Thorarchaeota archaeon]